MIFIGIDISQLADAISEQLQNYSEEVTEATKIAVDKTAKEVNKTIKAHVTFNQITGKYVKSFRIKKTYTGRYGSTRTWYVANGQHRLTHLLEKDHATRNGGRTKAFPHIQYGDELAQTMLPEAIEEEINKLR